MLGGLSGLSVLGGDEGGVLGGFSGLSVLGELSGLGGDEGGVLGGMSEDEFYDRLRAFLRERRPDLSGDVEPTTQLWEVGYLDSFGLIETLTFLTLPPCGGAAASTTASSGISAATQRTT